MDMLQAARSVISTAEASLRSLIQQALSEQKYSVVSQIADLANGVARLLDTEPARVPAARVMPPVASAAVLVPPQNRVPKETSPAPYPRFMREGDRLVKVGWSKKSKSAYEHRAPREAVVAFVRHLIANVPDDRTFNVESLLPVPGASSGEEIPAYQVYLTLLWLQQSKVIAKRGRDGYAILHRALTGTAFDDLWAQLPEGKR